MIYFNNHEKNIEVLNIFGNGEVWKQIEPLITKSNIYIENILEDNLINKENYSYKKTASHYLLYCVGYSNMEKRHNRYKELKESGFDMVSFIAENAIISKNTMIGNGTIINQGAIIDNFVEIGECVFVNIGSMISHDTKIGNNVFIAPGVNIAGRVNVGEGCFVGINATIIDHINIGEYSTIGAGSVVIDDIPSHSVVVGNPAKIIKRKR